MTLLGWATATSLWSDVLGEFLAALRESLPRLFSGLLFVSLAWVVIKSILGVLRRVLDRAYPAEQDMIVDLAIVIIGGLLWFGVLLVLLKILGMGEVAASLGTATGFIALGVAFALKEMIADTVAGVYLLRDPDFNVGDAVETASITGTIVRVDLRKTRIRAASGDLVVVANRDVEKRWTQQADQP
ncbi:mechanosensitive ion channel [Halodesulfurarchaeum sp. HSR-GB]|uniref:mechanosensitive ion channel family protein n=1 Tax=Halodesulfurarchaeum sp. HSR-GB TaxID=3074077 RepID=UPI00285A721C|nr:mechanosensitive ion channel domain-containing protein [Halodesulfurarchaeum sp. HSR-GB]MDR5656217.1 mechanosensitive ion channel [Halodesulfurarchaeum sp. HSR-GB]